MEGRYPFLVNKRRLWGIEGYGDVIGISLLNHKMKGWLCLLLVWGVLGVEVGSKCREKKSLMQIITKGKIIEAVEGIERIIEAGLLPDDIVSFTPKF